MKTKRLLSIALALVATCWCGSLPAQTVPKEAPDSIAGELDGLPRYMTEAEKLLPLPTSTGLRAAPT